MPGDLFRVRDVERRTTFTPTDRRSVCCVERPGRVATLWSWQVKLFHVRRRRPLLVLRMLVKHFGSWRSARCVKQLSCAGGMVIDLTPLR